MVFTHKPILPATCHERYLAGTLAPTMKFDYGEDSANNSLFESGGRCGFSIEYKIVLKVHHDAWNDFAGKRHADVNVKTFSIQSGLP